MRREKGREAEEGGKRHKRNTGSERGRYIGGKKRGENGRKEASVEKEHQWRGGRRRKEEEWRGDRREREMTPGGDRNKEEVNTHV